MLAIWLAPRPFITLFRDVSLLCRGAAQMGPIQCLFNPFCCTKRFLRHFWPDGGWTGLCSPSYFIRCTWHTVYGSSQCCLFWCFHCLRTQRLDKCLPSKVRNSMTVLPFGHYLTPYMFTTYKRIRLLRWPGIRILPYLAYTKEQTIWIMSTLLSHAQKRFPNQVTHINDHTIPLPQSVTDINMVQDWTSKCQVPDSAKEELALAQCLRRP